MSKNEHNTFRFAIGNKDKLHSLIWRVWLDKGLLLMLAPSKTAHISKVTFHFDKPSRFCHFAINKDYKTKMAGQGLKPPLHTEEVQWTLEPTPKINEMPLVLCSIILNYNPAHSAPNPIKPNDGKHLLCFSPPPPGKAWEVILAVTYHNPNMINIPVPFVKHEHIQLATGEYVMILGGEVDFNSNAFLKGKNLTVKTIFEPMYKPEDITKEPTILHMWNEPKAEPKKILRIYEFCGLNFVPKD